MTGMLGNYLGTMANRIVKTDKKNFGLGTYHMERQIQIATNSRREWF